MKGFCFGMFVYFSSFLSVYNLSYLVVLHLLPRGPVAQVWKKFYDDFFGAAVSWVVYIRDIM